MTVYTRLTSPLGDLLVTANGDGLSGLYYPDHRRGPDVAPDWQEDRAAFGALAEQLARYFERALTAFDVPLALTGTAFQQAVWERLAAVPYGSTTTYGELAVALGRPSAVRAVAGAVARNPVSIIVPCHRVLGAGGALSGYAGGIGRKRLLLDLESRRRARLSGAAVGVSGIPSEGA